MSELIDTTEMYLKAVYELAEEGIVPMRARIVERLDHSGPTVSQTVARMERDGLLEVLPDRTIQLSAKGQELATIVMRKHRLAECLLSEVVGLEWEYLHNEACRWEHVMSDRVEARLDDILGHPTHDPYGNPLPGRAERQPCRNLSAGINGDIDNEFETILICFGEPAQVDEQLLARARDLGVVPGAELRVKAGQRTFTVFAKGQEDGLEIAANMARHIFVK